VMRRKESKAVRVVIKLTSKGKEEEKDQKRGGWIRLRMI